MFRTVKAVLLVSILTTCMLLPAANANITLLETENHEFNFYGFLKADLIYQSWEMNNLYAGRWPQPDMEEYDNSYTTLTAQNSRFGFRWKGPRMFSNFNINGRLEWDLFDGSNNSSMRFRTRLAYLEWKNLGSSILMGQQWDLFSPLNPTTLNTNGNFWNVGNMGLRRGQLRYTYMGSPVEFALMMGDPGSVGGMQSNLPVFQGRVGFKLGEGAAYKFGFSGVSGSEDFGDDDAGIMGLGVDLNLTFGGGFCIKGEFATGENLNAFGSRADVYSEDVDDFEGQEVTASWIELVYSNDKIMAWGGYGMESLTDDEQIADPGLQDTSAFFAGIEFKIGAGASVGLEFTQFTGDFLDSMETYDSDSSTASQLYLSGIYRF